MTSLLITAGLLTACNVPQPYEEKVDPEELPTATQPAPPPECNAYPGANGQVYDCSTLDPCTNTDAFFAQACCTCDIGYCGPFEECLPETQLNQIPPGLGSSCMGCHNGSENEDYFGSGISNPHPFGSAAFISCTVCHGGNGEGGGKDDSHVPAPPELGDDFLLQNDAGAYFNYLTLVGIDKYPDYTVNGTTYSALEWLQFRNPGDIRVVTAGYSCGSAGCHAGEHVDWVSRNPIATETGFYSGTLWTSGIPTNDVQTTGLYNETAARYGFRSVEDPNWTYDPQYTGAVPYLAEFPEHAVYGDITGFYNNPLYDANTLPNFVYNVDQDPDKANAVIPGSPLEHVIVETTAFFCGDCHLGSAGANNRYADFRSSGCTSCHMQYSMDGRSRSSDPNVNKLEPANPDAIAAPERSHIDDHQIRNVFKVINGTVIRGISDEACVGCHQGSNRTVLQYWGIRLDQNQDVTNGFQYPANPVNFQDAFGDTRLYDPAVNNATFNGRVFQQHLVFEDYDGDNRDDTPEDIHYEMGMGCIDCHGSRDSHAGTSGDASSGKIWSREDQALEVQCTVCHGGIDEYAPTVPCEDYVGNQTNCAADRRGNPLRNVTLDPQGNLWLTSRVDGQLHYVPQTRDTVNPSAQKTHPITGNLLYTPLADIAMGRYGDGDFTNGEGPIQADPFLVDNGFAHVDFMTCESCHASWTNSCVGCHLAAAYDGNPANYFYSNTTGERIVAPGAVADFTYQSPVLFSLGVGTRGEIIPDQPGMKAFWRYFDLNGNESAVMAFSDVLGNGNNPNTLGRGAFPAMAHNKIMQHSTRGRVTANNEGPRYCVACHLNQDSLANFDANGEYTAFFADMTNRNYANLDYNLLQVEIGLNPGNQNNSPYFVHQAAGLGTGLFQFDAFGCPNNPLDANANRQYCQNGAPADNFDPNNTVYDLDRIVENTGVSNSSHNHPKLYNAANNNLRQGSLYPDLAGPMGVQQLQNLADPALGLVLDSWFDADGQAQGNYQ